MLSAILDQVNPPSWKPIPPLLHSQAHMDTFNFNRADRQWLGYDGRWWDSFSAIIKPGHMALLWCCYEEEWESDQIIFNSPFELPLELKRYRCYSAQGPESMAQAALNAWLGIHPLILWDGRQARQVTR